eukprot:gb/GFBE01068296.1/.p1 GENE.gb/GFBE01068296.1/~~gb/GFBE01068296.1/.p1  ORF type:complete len:226 (+),score=56.95 gb/GFBE01068296.1/:1-678(+)
MAPKKRPSLQHDPSAGRGKRQRTSVSGDGAAEEEATAAAGSAAARSGRGNGRASSGGRASSSGRGRAAGRAGAGSRGRGAASTRRSAAASAPAAAEAAGPAEGDEPAGRLIVRNSEVDAELANEASTIGDGTRATVLFHEPTFDTAMISLEAGGAEMAESNSTSKEMLYCVVTGEDGKVEFELPETRLKQRLSAGGEVLVPAGAAYVLRNTSSNTPAKLLAVVPR